MGLHAVEDACGGACVVAEAGADHHQQVPGGHLQCLAIQAQRAGCHAGRCPRPRPPIAHLGAPSLLGALR